MSSLFETAPLGDLRIAQRDGVVVDAAACVNDRDEAESAARWVAALHAAGAPWSDVLVVAPGKRKWRDRLATALDAAAVPHRMLLGEPGALPADGEVVHVASLYGAEGLSFPVVALVGLGDLPWKRQPHEEAVRVVQASIAVATRRLRISRSRPSALFGDRPVAAPATSPGSDARTRG